MRVKTERAVAVMLVVIMVLSFIAPPALAAYNAGVFYNNDDARTDYVCGLEEHVHDMSCYEQDLFSCRGLFEKDRLFHWDEERDVKTQFIVHDEHDELCYDSFGELICYLDEIAYHQHDENCYEYVGPVAPPVDQEPPEPGIPELPGDPDEAAALRLMDVVDQENWRLICDLPETVDWVEHYHNALCFDTDAVLVCELEEHTHNETCLPERPVEPDLSVSDEQVDVFVNAVGMLITDIRLGVYDENQAALDLACADIDALKLQFVGYELSESQALRVDTAISDLNDALDEYYAKQSEQPELPDFDLDGFFGLIDNLVADVNAGKYDSDQGAFDAACLAIDTQHAEMVSVGFVIPGELVDTFEQKLADYTDIRIVYATISASEKLLVAYIACVDKLYADAEAGLYDEDVGALRDAIVSTESAYAKVEHLQLTAGQSERLSEAFDRYTVFHDAMSGMLTETGEVQFVIKLHNDLVASSRDDRFMFQVNSVKAYDAASVVIPEPMFVRVNGAGDVAFEPIKFLKPGTYEFHISSADSDPYGAGDYRYDGRTWLLTVEVASNSDGLYVARAVYSLLGSDVEDSSVDACAKFITVGLVNFSWRPGAEKLAERALGMMTLEEKVGQLLLVHYPGRGAGSVAEAEALICAYHPAGMLVFGDMFDYPATPASVTQKIKDTNDASKYPLFFSVDEEGGPVCRVSSHPAFRSSRFPSVWDLSQKGSLQAVVTDVHEKAGLLLGLGLTVNHAPVADLSDANGSIGNYKRSWGLDPISTSHFVETYIAASNAERLGSTMKHFPGYGNTAEDTHVGFVKNYATEQELLYEHLLPFYAGIAAGGHGVMVTHNAILAWDTVNPASLSPAVYSFLRNDMRYDGVIMTDDLEMEAITTFVGEGQGALLALEAGSDLAMTAKPAADYPVVLAAVKSGRLSESEVDAKVFRTLCWKAEMGLIDDAILDEIERENQVNDEDAEAVFERGTEIVYGEFNDMMLRAMEAGGTVRLQHDCESVLTFNITKPITLDLCGCVLTYTGSDDFFSVQSGGTFNVVDSAGYITDVEISKDSLVGGYDAENRVLYYDRPITDVNGHGVVDTFRCADFSHAGRIFGDPRSSDITICLIRVAGGTVKMSGGVLENPHGWRAISSTSDASNQLLISGGAILNCGVYVNGLNNRGAGIWLSGGKFEMGHAYVAGCVSRSISNSGGGGGIFIENAAATFNGSVVAYNTAYMAGGGLYYARNDGSSSSFTDVTFTGNTVAGASATYGGNIFTTTRVDLYGNSSISYGEADFGGGMYAGGLNSQANVRGSSVVAYNHARNTGGGINVAQFHEAGIQWVVCGSSFIVNNTADVNAGGVYVRKARSATSSTLVAINILDAPHIKNNTVDGVLNNLYLLDGQYITVWNTLLVGTELGVYTEDLSGQIHVSSVTTGNSACKYKFDMASTAYFVPDLSYYESVLINSKMYFMNVAPVNSRAAVMLDGVRHDIGVFNATYSSHDYGRYVALGDVETGLSKFDVAVNEFDESVRVGVQWMEGGSIEVSDYTPEYVDGVWRIYLPDGDSFDNVTFWVLPNMTSGGTYSESDAAADYGWYSVRVNDVQGTADKTLTDVSSISYHRSGSDVSLTLPKRDGEYTWTVNNHADDDFKILFEDQDGSVEVTISDLRAPVVLTSSAAGDVRYVVQYYAHMPFLRTDGQGTGNSLVVVDTSNGKGVPGHGAQENELSFKRLWIEPDGSIAESSIVSRLYADRYYVYSLAPTLLDVDALQTDDHFVISEVWVLKPGHSSDSPNVEDWDVYRVDEHGVESIYSLSFTNSHEFESGENVVFIDNDSVIRFVYSPSESMYNAPVTFYDYCISDGFLYTSEEDMVARKNAKSVTSQFDYDSVYAYTYRSGINSVENYSADSGNRAHLAFGNANTYSGWSAQFFAGSYLNRYNGAKGDNSYGGCTFGLVTGLDGLGNLVYDSRVVAPNLFNEGPAIGKTMFDDYELVFNRKGDTYTLEAVAGTHVSGLSTFNHPTCGGTTYGHIWTNNFWPADDFSTFGANGHDLKFGAYDPSYHTYRSMHTSNNADEVSVSNIVPDASKEFNDSDDGLHHNSYFGMHFTIDFVLSDGYEGPLEYCFFGDDDMWAFLDGQLIVDIGGVHSSIGEYVNLWDYIDKGDTSNHRLVFYYTERGASGSTCWMHFTIPDAEFGREFYEGSTGSLQLSKSVLNRDESNATYRFAIDLTDADGAPLTGEYMYVVRDIAGVESTYGSITDSHCDFGLNDGQMISIPYLPAGTRFSISEDQYSCVTHFIVNNDDSQRVDGSVVEGVIELDEVLQYTCVNDFEGRPVLPQTGGDGHFTVFTIGCWCITVACACGLGVIVGRGRKRGKHQA